ncbi:uncharacterized protein A4U43_C02F19490 [Asparagus officinalis]|uniref:BRCT domain-containing protein n=1 Tax=Asparagus officinalis TaxID=4686 RepID=A0A5P1FJF8_ASPOF|nr:uncharacterized protein LOC109831691 isoform X1 [Asparagus officinalis]ONK78505.1 uncharacterized protein A4U43_C02F19490 [Asparagus officinalis]
MESCGYHSPQFSEDVAWLPAWLQPYQLPALGDGAKDEHTISQISSKKLVSLPKHTTDGQAKHFFTRDDGKYSGFHLYLSGDGNSSAGTVLSSSEEPQFHLHLSSLGDSQLSASQLNGTSHTGSHKTNQDLQVKNIHKIPDIKDDSICQHKVEAEASPSDSSMRNKSTIPPKQISRQLIKADQQNQTRLHEKPDAGNICDADINDAVELSIAASEAVVISDMVASSFKSENFPAAAILEISLRLKQAREKFCLDTLEGVSSFLGNKHIDDDLLSDLDDNIMAEAFDDVGISLTQIVETPDDSHYSEKPLQPNSSHDMEEQISESHFVFEEETQGNKMKDDGVSMGSKSKYLALYPLPLQQIKRSAFIPLDCIKSCLKSQPIVDVWNLQQKTDARKQTGPLEDRENHKDGKASQLGNATMRKNMGVFNKETSFISESMDEMNERPSKQIAEAEPELVASSSIPSQHSYRCLHRESERSIPEGHILSQDLVRSSSFDPFCSLVPCSIPSENVPISGDAEPKGVVSTQELNEKITLSDVQETPLKALTERPLILSKNSVDVPVAPSRKQLNSLRKYSTVMPDGNNYKSPSQSKVKQFLQFSSDERNNTCFTSNEPDAEISLNSMECMDVNGSKDNPVNRRKDQYEASGSPDVGEVNDDDFIHDHEDIGAPIILNNKKRRLRACKEILNCDVEEEISEKSSLKIRKCKEQNSRKSSLRNHSPNKQSLKSKKVKFSEVRTSIDRVKSSNRLQPEHQTHGARHRSSKRVKESILSNKCISRKENYNHLTFQHIVGEKGMVFQGLEFLLTGFSRQKEKELEALIRQYGGYILMNIPPETSDVRNKRRAELAQFKLPIVLSPKKVQTSKFLYGCATNTWMLNAHWLVDSIHAGSLLPPGKFMTRSFKGCESHQLRIGEPFCLNSHVFIFERVGFMLNGKVSFCTKFSKIIKHGGGKVFKSLQRLVQSLKNGTNTVGFVLVENEDNVSRHLKHCALENSLQTVPASWIVNSLFSGKLLPLKKERYAPLHRIKMPTFSLCQEYDMSQEI